MRHVFDLLTKLYAHDQGSVEKISKCRINPDFTTQLRTDLEFFVPEICSFYLRGESDEQNDILNLLTSACSVSFFFSHRLYFFLKSVISTQGSQDVKSECLAAMSEIQDMCQFEKEENLLYLANSKDLVSHIKNLRIDGLYPLLKRDQLDFADNILKPDDNIIAIKERFLKIKSMIAEYSEVGSKGKINRASMVTSQLTVKDIILLPFTASINHDKNATSGETSPILRRVDDNKVNAYLSTPRFIKYLTDISEIISKETDKKAALKRELKKLNSYLPASVYIPFCQDSLRNYAVLHIPPEEIAIFQTKSRAPYMITLELYRPDEMSMAEINNRAGRSHTNRKRRSTEESPKTPKNEQVEFFKKQEPLLDENDDEFFTRQRGKSNSVYIHEDNTIDVIADQKVSNPLFVSFVGNRPNIAETLEKSHKQQHKTEKQVKKFLLDSFKQSPITEHDDSFKQSDEEEDKVDYNNLSHQGPSSDDELVSSDNQEYQERSEYKMTARSKTGETPYDHMDSMDPVNRSVNRSGSFRKKSDSLAHYGKSDLNNILGNNKEDEISSKRDQMIKTDDKYARNEPTNFLFKETFDQCSERIRKNSVFGPLKTWKIAKLIVKSGDDLRQEQFAMQLIDCMSQIFQMDDARCWLKTYEILATDNG